MKTTALLLAATLLCHISRAEITTPPPDQKVLNMADAQLGVVLGANPNPPETRAVELLAERIKERSSISIAGPDAKPAFRLIVGTRASNEKIAAFADANSEVAPRAADSYLLDVNPAKGEIHVVGQSDSGVVAGIGRLMREMRYQAGRVEVPALRLAETPQMPNRGMYLWARKYYFNEPEKVDRYIEEFALWGGNALCLWFEMGFFESFEDTTGEKSELNTHYARDHKIDKSIAKDWIEKYRRFYATARRLGMKTGLIMVANDAYMSSPKEMRIDPIIGCPDWYMCPSKPGAVEKMLDWQEQVFQALAPIDIFNIFPADSGGCSCADCQPWPTGGFWKVAKPLGDRIHKLSPKTEIWIDTWHLNHPTFGGKDWQNLVAALGSTKERPEWFSGFEVGIAPNHRFAFSTPEDREFYNKAKAPLMVFPDISMWKNHQGMLVKKGYWTSIQNELNSYTTDLMKGGWPYAERWNTDIAAVMFLSWFWNSHTSVDAVIDRYTSFYFGSEAPAVRALLELLDDENKDPDRQRKIQESVRSLNASLPEWAKRNWRWEEIQASAARFK